MYKSKTIIAALIVCVNSRYLAKEDYRNPYTFVEDGRNIRTYDLEDALSEDPQHMHELNHLARNRRQAHGSISSNPDGSSNFAAKLPLAGSDKNILSAIGTVSGASGNGAYKAAGGGVAWDNVNFQYWDKQSLDNEVLFDPLFTEAYVQQPERRNGHGASLTGQHIPDFGNQLTAAGKVNLLHNDKHDVTANAFATRNFPSNPNIPSFDTYGGKVGYTYDNKLGASLGMAHTDLFKKTDYSAMGNLNLFRGRDSSLDFNAGMSKSVSPYIPSSRWEPSAGLSFTKWF